MKQVIFTTVFWSCVIIGIFAYTDRPQLIEQNWLNESTVCYMQGSRAISCETVRAF